MKTHTAGEITRGLGRLGLTFRSFGVSSEGAWSREDADWNYKDVAHLNVVHSRTRFVPGATSDDIFVAINMQKIAGLPVPIALADYVASDGTQVYFTTLVCFVLVVETKIVPLDESGPSTLRTRVETTYHLGGPRWAMLAFPLLRRILAANYRVLMSEDLPLRERRGRLRRAGFSFASDGRPRTFAETVDLTVSNVIAPTPAPEAREVVDLVRLEPAGASVVVGDGPVGVRLIRGEGSEVLVFDRVCSHEGASLDDVALGRDCLVCPWHAKRVRPLTTFDLADRSPRRLAAGLLELELDGERLIVSGLR